MKTVLLIGMIVATPVFAASAGSTKPAGSGFFRVEQRDGVWWFIDPQGQPFYSMGVNYCLGVSVEFAQGDKQSEWYRKEFAESEPVCRTWAERFRQWKFNTAGSVHGNWNGRFPHTPIFRCVFKAEESKVPKHEKYDFLDVYSPRFAEVCDAWARRIVKPYADDPLIIGWFIDNEFHLPQNEAFQRRFYQVAVGAIRAYDANHLILGTRHEYPNRTDLDLRMEGKFCDVLTANYYTLIPSQAFLERMHRVSGRPILIGEYTFAAKDSGLPNPRTWRDMLVETQADRAAAYRVFNEHLAAMPFVIGAHFFLMHDRKEVLMNNWGLADGKDNVYEGFVSRLAKIHERLPLIHAGKIKPLRYPDDYPHFRLAFNDRPHMENLARIGPDGRWVWQDARYYYECTAGTDILHFDRTHDDLWGTKPGGFVEYRFTLEKPIENPQLHLRYAALPGADAQRIRVVVNDGPPQAMDCLLPASGELGTGPVGYGYSVLRFSVTSTPLPNTLPAGATRIRFEAPQSWVHDKGPLIHGFFITAGPRDVSPNNYDSFSD